VDEATKEEAFWRDCTVTGASLFLRMSDTTDSGSLDVFSTNWDRVEYCFSSASRCTCSLSINCLMVWACSSKGPSFPGSGVERCFLCVLELLPGWQTGGREPGLLDLALPGGLPGDARSPLPLATRRNRGEAPP